MKVGKIIAPLIITILLIIYFALFLLGFLSIPDIWGIKIIGTFIFLGLIGLTIFVFIERIQEIRSGEEDDLSKY